MTFLPLFRSVVPCDVGMPMLPQEAGLLKNRVTTKRPCFPLSLRGGGCGSGGTGVPKGGLMVSTEQPEAVFTESQHNLWVTCSFILAFNSTFGSLYKVTYNGRMLMYTHGLKKPQVGMIARAVCLLEH